MNSTILTWGVFGGVWLAIWTIFSQFILFPNAKAGRALQGGTHAKSLNATVQSLFVTPIARVILRFVKLEEYHKETLEQTLSTAGIDSTAERYTANAIAYAFMVFLFCLPFGVALSPILILVAAIVAVVMYRGKIREAQEIVAEKRFKIELELPHFAATIQQQLASTRDVVQIFESYRKVCSREFEGEIIRTLADMKTGNYETALRNFENRMGSYKLSEVVRGLIGVLNGDNQIVHFEILTNDLTKSENEELRREAIKRKDKLNPNVMALFACMALMLFATIMQTLFIGLKEIL